MSARGARIQAKHLSHGAASAMERTRPANFAKFRIPRSRERVRPNGQEDTRTVSLRLQVNAYGVWRLGKPANPRLITVDQPTGCGRGRTAAVGTAVDRALHRCSASQPGGAASRVPAAASCPHSQRPSPMGRALSEKPVKCSMQRSHTR